MRNSSILQVRLPSDLKKLLERACANERITASEKIRDLIDVYVTTKNQNSVTTLPSQMTHRPDEIPQIPSNFKNHTFSVGEMYSGPGGIGMALLQTRLENRDATLDFCHSWATDYDPDTCRTYKNNVLKESSKALSICADVRELDISALPIVDGFLYGFPCNDFSLVGESLGLNGKFGGLFKYGVEYIARANPLFIFAENVSGLGSSNAGKTFELILKELNNAGRFGYDLCVHHYKFEDYGVPQSRHRFIIIGTRGDLKLKFQVPKPSFKTVTCKQAIEFPPIPVNAANNELTRQGNTVVERLKYIKPGQNAWTAELPEHLRLNVKGAKISQIYKRLDPNKPAYTVTGSGGGGTHVYHWQENRALTNRERARLQTFPDDFIFSGSKESVRAQIGMAVPVDGVKLILEALLKTFAKQKYPSVLPSKGFFPQKTL